ncbi:DUF4403 family protein [Puia dinghuensis]|uniref:DUF4403 family protein n=1 Tax=Puia dinghuensis TaxID=1792502 RepID=A0A8J2UIR1_9BACT|nr:DUF4403 family protein [Puia dinghuensis]GGB21870.1 hypothetical protein GCM10011511_52140 [Puia dinghuensis]
MRPSFSFLTVMFLTAAGFFACRPAKQLTTPAVTVSVADTLPALPSSEIDLPIKVAGRPLLLVADSLFPREFLSPGWPNYLQPSCDFRYKYRFVRSGFVLRCINNKISVALEGNYQVAGGKCLCALGKPVSPWISGYCGFDQEPMRRVDLAFSSQLNFQPDYHIRTSSAVDQVKALDPCNMSIFSVDMTQEIMDSIRSSINFFCRSFDVAASKTDVASYLRQAAAKAWQKTPIGPYGYLIINPLAVRVGTLNYVKDTFAVSLGISCRPELSSDSRNNNPPPLPALHPGPNRNGVTLYLPANYEYSFISKLLNDSLRDKSFDYKGRKVIVKEVAVRGIERHKLELRIDFGGSYTGRIYLRGTPVLDTAKQTLSVPDISYSLESRDILLRMAKTLLRGKIRRTMQGNSVLDLAAMLKANMPSLNTQLNRVIMPNLYTTGELKQLRLIGLLAGEKNIQAQLFMQADLAVTCTGLPR